jgi:hypothetical protein
MQRILPGLLVLTVLLAGCTAGGQPTAQLSQQAALPASDYALTDRQSSLERRAIGDRAATWEGGGEREQTVRTTRATYEGAAGSILVYTTPNLPYVGDDRVRERPAPAVAEQIGAPLGGVALASVGGEQFETEMLGGTETVTELVSTDDRLVGHVAVRAEQDVLVVVVQPGADRDRAITALERLSLESAS